MPLNSGFERVASSLNFHQLLGRDRLSGLTSSSKTLLFDPMSARLEVSVGKPHKAGVLPEAPSGVFVITLCLLGP